MGRKSRAKRQRREARSIEVRAAVASWVDENGAHALVPGKAPSPERLREMTQEYQQAIRDSPMWDEMVRRFGEEKASELLKQCKAELR